MPLDPQTLSLYETQLLEIEQKYTALPTGNVVFYGSSSIRLWPGLGRAFPEWTTENWGFGGSTLAYCAHFFERFIGPRKPCQLVIYGGDNDLALGDSPETVWENLHAIFEMRDRLFGPIETAVFSIKLSPARTQSRELVETANEWCQREVLSRQNAVWVEIFEEMLS